MLKGAQPETAKRLEARCCEQFLFLPFPPFSQSPAAPLPGFSFHSINSVCFSGPRALRSPPSPAPCPLPQEVAVLAWYLVLSSPRARPGFLVLNPSLIYSL